MAWTKEQEDEYLRKKKEAADKAEAQRLKAEEEGRKNKARAMSSQDKYQSYVDSTAPTSPTVTVSPASASTYDTVNANSRAAWMNAVENGYRGTYADWVAGRR